ncbi:unnamed protein product [Amoebophrya sp. A120]|nr:unnamed protein product [Amoebophrya sp. A120]|eukprot:GSA120T00022585001.1
MAKQEPSVEVAPATSSSFFPCVSLAVHDPRTGLLEKHIINRKHPLPHDVLIDIQYAGICHSDIHQARAEWPIDCIFPMVPGHEIAGVVEKVGKSVTKFKVGERVSVGCFVDSCRDCVSCHDGVEQYCMSRKKGKSEKFGAMFKLKNLATYNCCVGEEMAAEKGLPDTILYGGYSKKITVDENYIMRIPDSLDFAKAAPLACAGITTYSPLNHYGVLKAGKAFRVGIIGVGGLGAMAVKFCKAVENETWCISSSERKKEYCLNELQADGFVVSSDKHEMQKLEHTFDFLLCTISADFEWSGYLNLLKPQATICLVGLPPNKCQIKPFDFVARRIKIVGSLIGGIAETQEMLDFCAKHNIASDVEIIAPKEINRAWMELTKNANRKARFVIDWTCEPVEGGDWETEKNKEHYNHVIHPDATLFGAPPPPPGTTQGGGGITAGPVRGGGGRTSRGGCFRL